MSEDMFRTVGRTDGEAADCSQLLAGRRAVHTFLTTSPLQESNGVCCVDRDSFQEKREEEESGARSERESPRIARVSWISKVSCSKG